MKKEKVIYCKYCGKKKEKISWQEISEKFNSKTGRKDIKEKTGYFCTNYYSINPIISFLTLGIRCGLNQKGCLSAISDRINRCKNHVGLGVCNKCGACLGYSDI